MPAAVSRLALIVICSVLLASVLALALRFIDARHAPPIVIVDTAAERPVIVLIDGAVASPGVQTLPAGARLNDAVTGAGGFTTDADSDELNLARLLVDGERVTVGQIKPEVVDSTVGSAATAAVSTGPAEPPAEAIGATTAPTAVAAASATATTVGRAETLIDINTAGISELDGLPGIGPVLAQRIIQFRETNGPYRSVNDLEAVDGISATTVEELRPLITTGTGAP